MIEIHERQTASFLKEVVLEVIRKYGLRVEQIFSVTTDNGTNMLAAVKKLQKALEQSICEAHFEDNDDQCIPRNLLERVSEELEKQISLVRCSAHTLQLAINDVFSKRNTTMQAVTDIVKAMRHIKYKAFIEMHKLRLPPLWSPERWGGKHKMVSCILQQESLFSILGTQYPELSKFFRYLRTSAYFKIVY